MAQPRSDPTASERHDTRVSDDVAADPDNGRQLPKDAQAVDVTDTRWRPISKDLVLSRAPESVGPGNTPAGGDLRFDIGWDRFEQLILTVARAMLGLNRVEYRRYGVTGQAQHGIDLAGRHADGSYTVIQCKEYERFEASDLRDSVAKFTSGRRPFGSAHLIVATTAVTKATQVEDELARQQDAHKDVRIDLWGADQINDALRLRADIVSRFWSRETADTFCTGAPLPGVAAAPPNWLRVADQILLGPLGVDGLEEQLAAADLTQASDPRGAACSYRSLAQRLEGDGFHGHAHVLRRKQLDALVEGGDTTTAVQLAAALAAAALHAGDVHEAEALSRRLDEIVEQQRQRGNPGGALDDGAGEPGAEGQAAEGQAAREVARHARLVRSSLSCVRHPLGDCDELVIALREPDAYLGPTDYEPVLVLLLGELTAADEAATPTKPASTGAAPNAVALLDDLITSAMATATDKDVELRLRLLKASYDSNERAVLLAQGRQLKLPREHAALVLASEARRNALAGSAEDAIEHWRQAVASAVHQGLTHDAASWLYAMRAVNLRYGPWTSQMEQEHLLAQSLPKTGDRLLPRAQDAETASRRACMNGNAHEAIRHTRRWLADCIVTGDWVNEYTASEILGDLYAENAEPQHAAACYQWGGDTEKLSDLVKAVGDRLLAASTLGSGAYWQQTTGLALLAAQHDLIDDTTAGELLPDLLDIVERGRAGELVDGPTGELTLQATKALCALAGRGTPSDAQELLDLFAADVARAEDRYYRHDEQHVKACESIATHHPEMAWPALRRIVDLAEFGANQALRALHDDVVLGLLKEEYAEHLETGDTGAALTHEQQEQLRGRLRMMAGQGVYEAGLAVLVLGDADDATRHRACDARDRLLNRPEPEASSYGIGSRMGSDAFMVGFLDDADRQACLDKMLTVAQDRIEVAMNRQDALLAASNLVIDLSDDAKLAAHQRSRPFVKGEQDGSAHDSRLTNPHPLSTLRVDFGSASLRAAGLRLARNSAVTDEEHAWVYQQATAMLRSEEAAEVHTSAVVLHQLGPELLRGLDPALLASHAMPVVRQLAAIAATLDPNAHRPVLEGLMRDPESSVRIVLAQALHESSCEKQDSPVDEVLATLTHDARHSVRFVAATGRRA